MLVRHVWPSRPALTNPFADLENNRRREMLRFLDSLADDSFAERASGGFPPMNITQDDNHFYVRAEVPGIRASDLSISAVRNRISISGRREIPQEHERVSYHRKERADGTFNRTVALPTLIDAERVEAHYSEGVLTVRLPKAAEAKPRQISIKT
jgi:HSP20 family protein